MTRFLSFLLLIATLLSLFSCAKTETTETETFEPDSVTEEKEEEVKTLPVDPWKESAKNRNMKVNDTSAKEKLAAIPVATSEMTTDELRQICVDFMRLQLSFPWMPSETFQQEGLAVTREPGTVYGGIPYISSGSGSLYRILEYYDEETGIIDVSPFQSRPKFFTNACSGSVFWAWFRVVNSFYHEKGAYTQCCTEQAGCIRVGDYVQPKDVSMYSSARNKTEEAYTCKDVVEANSQQVMFESYAKTQIADGVVHPGHVRMVTVSPVVVRNEDGTINGKESYLHCSEQIHYTGESNKRTQEDGSVYVVQGHVDKKYTFNELHEKNYIPFTFAELIGTDPVEKAEVSIGVEGTDIPLDTLRKSTMKCNYVWSDIYLTVTDKDGNEVFKRVQWADEHYYYEAKLHAEILADGVVGKLKELAKTGEHNLTLKVQLANGERITFYEGKLVV